MPLLELSLHTARDMWAPRQRARLAQLLALARDA